MAEELEGGGAGVVPEGTGAGADATITEASVQVPAGAGDGSGADGKKEGPVDLTKFEEFRRWQAARDRKEAGYQQQLTEAQRRAADAAERARALEERMALAEMEDKDPSDVIRFFQEKDRKREAELQRQAQEQRRAAELTSQVVEELEALGLSWDTPGLDKSGGATPEGYAMLMKSAAGILSLRAGELAKQTAAEAQAAAREARRETLVESGAAQVSTSAGGTPISLRAEYEAKMKGIRRGDVGAVVRLQTEMRKKGLDI